VSCAAFGIGTGIYELVFNLHLIRLGYSADDIGTLYLATFLAMCVVAVPAGVLADRFGRRWFLVVASFAGVSAQEWTHE
jgi:MFS family permease